MIEKLIRNELSLKRWRRFKARKTAVASAILLLLMVFCTCIAAVLSNDRPLIMKYKGETFYPVFVEYHPKKFGITNSLVIKFRNLELSGDDYAIWPMIKWNPYESNEEVESYPSEPSYENLLGTDDRGRDVLARLLYGFRYSIGYAFCVWAITTLIAIICGGIMGFAGGRVDFIAQRFVEILSTVPQFFLLIILVSIFEPNLYWLILISSIFGWIALSYYVRAEFLKNRKKEYVEAAISLGASNYSVIFKHILPNSLTPVITYAPFTISANIIGLASLDYLGFGLVVPTPSWGELLQQAQAHINDGWWLAVFPSISLFVTLTAMNLLGEGVRDAMDPNMV
ncbi:MAG: ABC transporter permease subunit [Bacteriovoracaceae bacterium]|jgi:microcin C transport system permease protein|nr:ABC transporter permease subunit [Bacteriovoracaceae bacterium]